MNHFVESSALVELIQEELRLAILQYSVAREDPYDQVIYSGRGCQAALQVRSNLLEHFHDACIRRLLMHVDAILALDVVVCLQALSQVYADLFRIRHVSNRCRKTAIFFLLLNFVVFCDAKEDC